MATFERMFIVPKGASLERAGHYLEGAAS